MKSRPRRPGIIPDPARVKDRKGADEGWAVVSTMLGGFAVWGGIGWLLDQWWGTKFALPVGVIVGMVLGIYAVIARVIHSEPAVARPTDPTTGPPPASTRRETE
ncbi:MAG: AtpZ/AtpI family protein [Nakamurella sp.]